MRAARLAALMLAAGACAPLAAQAQQDRARIDEFAVGPAGTDTLEVEQLGSGEALLAGSPQPHDKATSTAQTVPRPNTALQQLSSAGQRFEQPQLSKTDGSPSQAPAAVSSTADSRPQGATRIGGTDRCDPQLVEDELEECQRILELRAREFNATAPPTLSVEQKLLAEQQTDEDRPTSSLASVRLRLAAMDAPDADLQSNQELAAIYLENHPTSAVPPPDRPAAEGDASLVQILEGLQIETAGQATGN